MHLASRGVLLCLGGLILVSCEENQIQPPPPDVPPGTGAPAVVEVIPEPGATQVQRSAVLRAVFSEQIDPTSITSSNFTVTPSGVPASATLATRRVSGSVFGASGALLTSFAPADSHQVDGSVTASDSLAVFTPTSPFEPNTNYSARISGAVRDRAGNPMGADYVWSFTTGPPADTTAPTVAAVSPADGAEQVVVTTTVRATFSEVMDPVSLDVASFLLSGPGGGVSGTVDLTGAVATFAPSAPLEPNTVYTARVTMGAEDLAGNSLAVDHVWTFTTAPPPDLTRPTIVSVVPLSTEPDVDLSTTIRATFSEAVAPTSVHAGTFLLSGTGPVAGTVTLTDFTAVFTPSSPLAPNTTYTARVTEGIEDLAGNALASDYVWTFTTAAPPDQTPPTVAAVTPQNGATGITTGTAVTAMLSEPPAPASVTTATFLLSGGGVGAVAGAVTLTDRTATFTPSSSLSPNTTYTARLTSGIEDPAGNNLATDFVWSFTTAPVPDQTQPTVVPELPSDNATNVDHGTVVQATFSEPVTPASVSGVTFLLRRGTSAVWGSVSLSGQLATFTPSAPLAANATYTVRVTTGVEDLAGNNLDADVVWTFTTAPPPDLTRPTVTSTDPLQGDTDVAADAVVRATFSEAVSPPTVNTTTFRLTGGVGTVSGTVSVSGNTATFTPAGPLEASTTYTARLTTGVEDLAGNHLAAEYVWTFSTSAAPDETPPSVVSVLPFTGSSSVDPTTTVRADFSEPMAPASLSTSTFRLNAGATVIVGTVTLSGQTATFTPSSSLAYLTTYTARVTTGVEDVAGNNMVSEFVWSFTTQPAPDVTRPVVTSIVPLNGATGVDPATTVRATFSEPVAVTSVNTSTFRLSGGAGAVTGTVTLSGQTATFSPSSPLAYSTTFTGRVTTGVEDQAGNHMASDFVWTFVTRAEPDVTPPTITALSPANGATGIDPNANVTATFSEAMDAASVNGTSFLLSSTGGSVAGAVTMTGNTATLNPTAALAYSTTYTARVTTGVEDLAGNNLASDRVWTFTTEPAPDVTPPTVTVLSPANAATGIDPSVNVTATFSEPMNAATVSGTTFRLTVGASTVAATVTLSGNMATLNPSSPLAFSTTYTARVTTGVEDLAGNHLAADRVWSFTTGSAPDVTPPSVVTTVPASGATGVDVDGNVTATFSEAMDPASVSGTSFLLSSTGGSVAGAVTLSGNTATFNPTSALAYSTTYTARVTTGVEDLAGNNLTSDRVWTFTTEPAPDTTSPTVTVISPTNAATGVDPNVNVTATFSEAMDAASVNGTTFLLSSTGGSVAGAVTMTGNTATFNPTGALAYSTMYTARVTTGVEDLAGNNLASDRVWTFTTEPAPDVTPPTVTVISPANAATGIDPSVNVTATFSEPMNAATVSGTTFRLTVGASTVAATVTLSGNTATLNPSSPLAYSTTYTARVTTGVEDLAGNHLAADRVWSFTTGSAPDVTPPSVVTTVPASGATGVDVDGNVTATFSEAMDPASVSGTSFLLSSTGGSVAGAVTLSGNTATLNPTSALAYSTTYTARVTTGVQDLAGNNLTSDRVWTFTTEPAPDTTPPTVTVISPANAATGIDVNGNVTATFSEAMDVASVNGTTFLLSSTGGSVAGAVTMTGNTATFNPTGALAYSTTYTARVTTGVEDLAGNNLASDRVWTFTTEPAPDVTPPTVTVISPANAATGVDPSVNVTATFSEPMDAATVNGTTFRLTVGASTVTATVTLSGNTATLNPSSPLAYSTTYTARVTTGVQDLAGNHLATDRVWSFTTGAAPDVTPPSVVTTVPASGATGVDVDGNVTATFSEAMDPASVSGASFLLSSTGGSVAGAVTMTGNTATFNPTAALAYSTTYTARVTTGVQDLAGNNLTSDRVWTFTTEPAPDTTPPTVTVISPANAATGIDVNGNVTATFSEAVDAASVNGTTFLLSSTGGSVAGAVTMTGNTATFNPTGALAYSTMYTARVTTGVEDLAGNNLASDRVWTFTTEPAPDVTPPTVTVISPANAATGIDPNVSVTATFSEPMDAATVNGTTFRLTVGASTVTASVSLSGNTATLNPSSPLAYSTTYTARVTTGVQDLAGNHLATDRVWSFTTGAAPDVTPPSVVTTVPASGATEVDVDGNVTATFSEAMDPASVSGASFLLSSTGGSVAGAVTLSGNTATLNPTSALAYSTTYTARVTTGVQDLAGNNLTSDRVWTFTTEPAPDTTPPAVTASTPTDGATGVDPNVNVTATFSEAVDAASVNGTTFLLSSAGGSVAGAVTMTGNTATLNPTGALAYSTTYTARVTTGVQDLAGNNMNADHVWTFTTEPVPDTTPPVVTTEAPPDGASAIDVSSNVTATFSEPMDASSVNGTTFLLNSASGSVAGAVTMAGNIAIFNPTGTLAYGTTYTARVTTGAQDLAGNPMASDHVWTFTTGPEPDTTPPTVTTKVPAPDATDVSRSTTVSATFSEAVDGSTVTSSTFRVEGSQAVPGTLSVNGTTVTFTPADPLDPVTPYTVTLTTGIHDLAGNALASEVTWTFTTTDLPPVANAGPDQDVTVLSTVTLDGTGSFDPEGEALAYVWTQVAGADVTGGSGTLQGPNPSFTAPLLPDVLEFDLRVDDGAFTSVPDRLRVDVQVLLSRSPEGPAGAPRR